MDAYISIMSLIVTALAVVVGPMVSWKIAKRQISSSLETSNKGIIGPMRQAWIDKLRELLAEFTSDTLHYWEAGFDDRKETEYRRLALLETQIQLMLNPNETDHQRLECLMHRMVHDLSTGRGQNSEYPNLHPEMIALSRRILKREWDRVKKPMSTGASPIAA